MTVFGFGRQATNKYLTGTREFVVGLADQTGHAGIQPVVLAARSPVPASAGAPTPRP